MSGSGDEGEFVDASSEGEENVEDIALENSNGSDEGSIHAAEQNEQEGGENEGNQQENNNGDFQVANAHGVLFYDLGPAGGHGIPDFAIGEDEIDADDDDDDDDADDEGDGNDWDESLDDDSFDGSWELYLEAAGSQFDDEFDEDSSSSSDDEESTEGNRPLFRGPNHLSNEEFGSFEVRSSVNHKQVADAVCADGGDGNWELGREVVMFNQRTVQIRRLPSDSDKAVEVLYEHVLRPIGFIGNVPFSVARTECGRFLAIAGECGFVYFIELTNEPNERNDGHQQHPGSTPAQSTQTQEAEKEPDGTYRQVRLFIFATSERPQMTNSVRFGKVGGKERLIVACQDKRIVFFDLPNETVRLPIVPTLTPNAGDSAQVSTTESTTTVLHMSEEYVLMERAETAALGPFQKAINFSVASSDGRWLAVCGDMPVVYLLDEREGYCIDRAKQLRYKHRRDAMVHWADEAGSQYGAFNPSGTKFVATSDMYFTTIVWDIESCNVLCQVNTRVAPLAVTFITDDLFIFTEEKKRAHVVDSRYPNAHQQVIKVPKGALNMFGQFSESITGVASTQREILLATTSRLFRFNINQWSFRTNKYHPEKFKAAVRTVLLGACQDENCDLYCLPRVAIDAIIAHAADPQGDWLESDKHSIEYQRLGSAVSEPVQIERQ